MRRLLSLMTGLLNSMRASTLEQEMQMVTSISCGRTEEFTNVVSGRAYDCIEGKGLTA